MKKRIVTITAIVLLVAITIFAVVSHQRRNDDPFLELTILYTHLYGRPHVVFTVKSDRTFISLSRSGLLEDREELILGEQEFQRISELLSAVIDDYHAETYQFTTFLTRTSEWYTLKHNGYEYINSSIIPNSLLDLYNELRRLSPLNFPR